MSDAQPTNTHYGVVVFTGDPDEEHPNESLRGRCPHMELICAGTEEGCWAALNAWTMRHPLEQWQHAEVLARMVSLSPSGPFATSG